MSAQVKLDDLVVDAYATFGRQQILCSATPLMQYDKQKQKHTDERLGTKYTVACPSLGMRSITVKSARGIHGWYLARHCRVRGAGALLCIRQR